MCASFELKAISVANKADTKLNRTNVRLACDHLYEKYLFTWLSLVMSLMVSFDVVLFPPEMSWMKFGTYLSQFLMVFLPTFLKYIYNKIRILRDCICI